MHYFLHDWLLGEVNKKQYVQWVSQPAVENKIVFQAKEIDLKGATARWKYEIHPPIHFPDKGQYYSTVECYFLKIIFDGVFLWARTD